MLTKKKFDEFLKTIPVSSLETNRWDKEWISYFNTEEPKPFLLDLSQSKLEINIHQFKNLSESEILSFNLIQGLPALNLWVQGSDLVNKRVFEIGCGPGVIGKQLGLLVKNYLGIDYSNLALSIARLVSPNNCDYIHLSESHRLLDYAESMDTMISRFFFIHQNFDNALWVLKLANFLLKPNGIISADFYQANPEIPQGIVFPAKHPLSREYPSCGFEFTEAEIQELATESDFEIASMTKDTLMQRLFVRFEKQG
ncbi:MAG: hypothetical protein Fur006_00920 [Coleofasciculaceae cyanobacterium]